MSNTDFEIPIDDDDQGIEIDISKDDPPSGADGKPSPRTMTDDAGAALSRMREEVAAAKQAESAARSQLEQARVQQQTETAAAHLATIETALQATQQKRAQLKAELRDAQERGDFDRATDIIEKMSATQVDESRLTQGRDNLKARVPQQSAQQAQQPQISERSRQFLDSRKGYWDTPPNARKLTVAHDDAIANGLEADTDEYFSYIDQRMEGLGVNAPNKQRAAAPNPTPQRRSTPAPAAPVGRGSSNPARPSSNPNTVHLSKAQIETANELGIDLKEYARNLVRMSKENQ